MLCFVFIGGFVLTMIVIQARGPRRDIHRNRRRPRLIYN